MEYAVMGMCFVIVATLAQLNRSLSRDNAATHALLAEIRDKLGK
jgi:hypothetical protein